MRIKTKLRKPLILTVSMWYYLFVGMIGRYSEKGIYWFALSIVLLLVLTAEHSNQIKKIICRLNTLIVLMSWLCILFMNVLIDFNISNIYTNLINLAFPFIIGSVLLISKQDNRFNHKRFLQGSFGVINCWWMINLIVVSIQNTGNPFLIKSQWLADNSFYPDLCCGLFGFNGTHELAFFSCCVLIIDLYYIEICKSRTVKVLVAIWMVLSEAFNLVLSFGNDNKASFILIPATLVIYIIFKLKWEQTSLVKRSLKYLKYVAIGVVLIIVLLRIPQVMLILKKSLFPKVWRILFYRRASSIDGGNERLAIISDSFSSIRTWLIGEGIGSSLWIEEKAHGYSHYGLNSMGSFLVQMGVWFTSLQIILYSGICYLLTSLNSNRKIFLNVIRMLCIVYIVTISIYSPIFTSYTSSYWIFMVFYCLGGLHYIIQEKKYA